MLWDLQSEGAGMFYRSWNTCVKLAYNIPRSTHTYLVENYLAAEFTPIRTELMARYIKFYDSLLNSKSFEIQVLVNTRDISGILEDYRGPAGQNWPGPKGIGELFRTTGIWRHTSREVPVHLSANHPAVARHRVIWDTWAQG